MRKRACVFAIALIALLALCRTATAAEQKPGKFSDWVVGKVSGAAPVGSETCAACHPDQVSFYEATRHRKPFLEEALGQGCESCHGPASKHLETAAKEDLVNKEDLGKLSAHDRSSLCLSCHFSNLLAKRNMFYSQHAQADVSCWDCHDEMLHFRVPDGQPKPRMAFLSDAKEPILDPFIITRNEYCYRCHETQRMEFAMPFRHQLERGKMACMDCHDPHGEPWRTELVTHSVSNEADSLCFRCHTEQRGPFVWQHQAMEEGCTNCHQPHGSANRRLLKVSGNTLCLQCHFETQFPVVGQVSHDFKLARQARCLDCHVRSHGSNVSEDLTQ